MASEKNFTETQEFLEKLKGNNWLTAKQVAGLYGISERTLAHLREKGEGPLCYKIGAFFKYKLEDVLEYLKNCQVGGKK